MKRYSTPGSSLPLLLFFIILPFCKGEEMTPEPEIFHSPEEWGPFEVGRLTFEWVDEERDGREVTTDIWYPAIVGEEEKSSYFGFEGEAYDSPLLSYEKAPYPVVLFSHGNQGIRYQSIFLTEFIASHGFLVAAMDHQYNTFLDYDGDRTWEVALMRPGDVSFVIDKIIEENRAGGFLDGFADTDNTAVSGHSFGGFTALAVAGAPLNLDSLREYCQEEYEVYCDLLEQVDEEIKWYPLNDERVKASLSMTPGGFIVFDTEGIEKIEVPVLVMGGDSDEYTLFEEEQLTVYQALNPPKFLMKIFGAGHFTFSNICDIPIGWEESCTEEYIDPDIAHSIIQTFGVSFFSWYLKGDERYLPYLQSPYPDGIEYIEYQYDLGG